MMALRMGIITFQNLVTQTVTIIRKHVILNTGVILEQGSQLEDFVHLEVVTTVYGQVFVGEGTLIDTGTTVILGIYTGKWCVIGVNAVITKDIQDYSVAVGMPARVIASVA